MSSQTRLTKAYKNALRIPFDRNSKIVLFSDCHRGDNSFADDFANNRNIYLHALKQYFKQGFTYFELGDGDELWENSNFKSLFKTHKNVYMLLKAFHEDNRLHMIWGNHDMVYSNENYVKKHLSSYYDPKTKTNKPLFTNIQFHEAIVLKHTKTGQEIFLAHGHQADWRNYILWKFNRFMVRFFWRPLQITGIHDPTSPAKNNRSLEKVEEKITQWIKSHHNLMTVIGHTHRPRFPETHEPPLFNDGSCVHPRCITGIEIENDTICLIKWHTITTDEGFLKIEREVLEGPRKLSDYQQNTQTFEWFKK